MSRISAVALEVPANPFRAWASPAFWLAAAALWLDGITCLAGVAVLILVGVGLIGLPLLLIGLPIFVLGGRLLWWLGDRQRALILTAHGKTIARPDPPHGWRFGLRPALSALRDGSTWSQLSYWLARIPTSILTFTAVVLLFGLPLPVMLLPLYWRRFPTGSAQLGPFRIDDGTGAVVAAACAAVLLLLLAPGVVVALSSLDVALATRLLGGVSLTERVAELAESRARVVDAADVERRRIERDLHDGAQQRLTAVAMTIGRARLRLRNLHPNTDSELVELLDRAHADAKLAITELRDLTRGLQPPILADRGLDAALSALAGRSPIPTKIITTPRLVASRRPSIAIESVGYFVVSEAITNAVKHAEATMIEIQADLVRQKLVIAVADNGHGGAVVIEDGGIAGLRDRARSVDGTLSVSSPDGGPTKIIVELPCVW